MFPVDLGVAETTRQRPIKVTKHYQGHLKGDERRRRYIMDGPHHNLYEARRWLTDHPDGFFADRFADGGSALQFVERLYAAGASRVDVYSDDNGPYMTFMRVTLPTDLAGRARLFAICNQESDDYGENFETEREYDVISKEQAAALGRPEAEGSTALIAEPVKDQGQTYLTFWWD
jgi:hypothetical protein